MVRHKIVRAVLVEKGIKGNELEVQSKAYVDEYNNKVQSGIQSLGLLEDVMETLEKLSKKYLLFINTATPKDSIDETVNNLGISRYFKEIYGATTKSKTENLSSIVQKKNLIPSEVVVIGDGENDVEAAKENETHFIGFANDWNKWEKQKFQTVKSFNEIEGVLKKYES